MQTTSITVCQKPSCTRVHHALAHLTSNPDWAACRCMRASWLAPLFARTMSTPTLRRATSTGFQGGLRLVLVSSARLSVGPHCGCCTFFLPSLAPCDLATGSSHGNRKHAMLRLAPWRCPHCISQWKQPRDLSALEASLRPELDAVPGPDQAPADGHAVCATGQPAGRRTRRLRAPLLCGLPLGGPAARCASNEHAVTACQAQEKPRSRHRICVMIYRFRHLSPAHHPCWLDLLH